MSKQDFVRELDRLGKELVKPIEEDERLEAMKKGTDTYYDRTPAATTPTPPSAGGREALVFAGAERPHVRREGPGPFKSQSDGGFSSACGIAAVVPADTGYENMSDEELFGDTDTEVLQVAIDYVKGEIKNQRKTFESGAVRDSAGKLRFDLIPHEHTREMAKVLTMGAAKYAPRNWEHGIPFSELYASAARHINAFLSGEYRDAESGLLHVSHACWNLMAIETMLLRGQAEKLDDLTPTHDR